MSIDTTRRSFLKGTAAAGIAAGALVSPAIAEEPEWWLPQTWDKEADVVVVGFGGAGAMAALSAYDAGSEVLILEKAPIEGGGASRMSGAGITFCEEDKVEDAAQYIHAITMGETPLDVCRAFAEGMTKVPDFLEHHGYEFAIRDGYSVQDFPALPGGTDTFKGIATIGNGLAFWGKSLELIEEYGIQILFDTPAVELVQNPRSKEILGVWAEQNGERIAIKARQGVVLACGGFEFDEEMCADYLKLNPMVCVGWPYNTGDGIKMAQKAGADLWHMSAVAATQCTTKTDNTPIAWLGAHARGGSHIWVTRRGKRFICEHPFPVPIHRSELVLGVWDLEEKDAKSTRYLTTPFYMVFDEKCRLAGPIGKAPVRRSAFTVPPELYGLTDDEQWSDDNSREVELGWIKKADTIEELAAFYPEIDAEQLVKTIEEWNASCAAGYDPMGRVEDAFVDIGWHEITPNLCPIDTPPYYILPMWPAIYHTCGGPRKNGKGQVLDVDKNPIPRLYEAGSCGSTVAHAYGCSGHNWAEVTSFGIISGTECASLERWE